MLQWVWTGVTATVCFSGQVLIFYEKTRARKYIIYCYKTVATFKCYADPTTIYVKVNLKTSKAVQCASFSHLHLAA